MLLLLTYLYMIKAKVQISYLENISRYAHIKLKCLFKKIIFLLFRADVIQTLTMVLVSGAFIIQSTVKAGGPEKVIADNIDGNRLEFFK